MAASVEGSSGRIAVPANSEVIRIASTGAVWLAFGNSSVAAAAGEVDSMIFTAGTEYFHLRNALYTDIAARSVVGEGSVRVTITRME